MRPQSEVIQFEIPLWMHKASYGHNPIVNDISVISYDPKNKGSKFYTYKALVGKTNKAKFFNEAFNWLAEYKPNEKIEFIKCQLHGCKYNLKNNRANLLGYFKRLKSLNKSHFENWSFNKFLKKVH